jgi:hypothetical protein
MSSVFDKMLFVERKHKSIVYLERKVLIEILIFALLAFCNPSAFKKAQPFFPL